MSVVGLDVGNDTLVAAAARQRGIDVLLNVESKRESPAAVAFSHSARRGRRILPRPLLQPQAPPPPRLPPRPRDLPRLPFLVDIGARVHVDHLGRRIALSPTHILDMLLTYLRQLGEDDLNAPVADCVISVPCYLPHAGAAPRLRRRGAIAGLRPLRLMHDLAVTALGYGL
ncbi:heat shock 70 kDa protein 16 [Hordeum vulgare]|nr:heat shock 70 kDa protein 16 [Hordeum vulgare]